ncbi:VOC family protein [Glaciibacter flavus]|uniref:VOC family protein n=1 Tax=Orlajensenia flava TaxID=2565934 RepID=UPI003AFF6138
MQFASVRIITSDVPRAADFYERLLGVKAERPAPVFASFRGETGSLAIGDARTVPIEGFAEASGGVIIEFLVDGPDAVDATHEEIRSWVETIVQAPADMPWGNRSMLLRDPDGNLVNIYAPLRQP